MPSPGKQPLLARRRVLTRSRAREPWNKASDGAGWMVTMVMSPRSLTVIDVTVSSLRTGALFCSLSTVISIIMSHKLREQLQHQHLLTTYLVLEAFLRAFHTLTH